SMRLLATFTPAGTVRWTCSSRRRWAPSIASWKVDAGSLALFCPTDGKSKACSTCSSAPPAAARMPADRTTSSDASVRSEATRIALTLAISFSRVVVGPGGLDGGGGDDQHIAQRSLHCGLGHAPDQKSRNPPASVR